MAAVHPGLNPFPHRPPPNDLSAVGWAAESDISYRDEFNRLCSFPTGNWNGTRPKHSIVSMGYYFCESNLRCAFCPEVFDITDDESLHQHRRSCSMTGNVLLGCVTNYYYERNRLVSFLVAEHWTAPVVPEDLAKDGFYWIGTGDATRCNFCRLEVREWAEGDTPNGEHQRWNPSCLFLQGRSTGNVPLGMSAPPPNEDYDFVFSTCAAYTRLRDSPGVSLNLHYMEEDPHVSEEELCAVMRKQAPYVYTL